MKLELDKKNFFRNKYAPVFAGIALLILSLIVFYIMLALRPEPKTVEKPENLPSLRAIKVRINSLSPEIIAYGTTRPQKIVEIHAEVKGRVTKCIPDFKPGRIVNQNEILLEIEKDDYTIALNSAQAKLDEIRASISETKQKQQDDTERLEVTKKDLELSRKNLDRAKTLFEKSAISESDLDKAEQAFVNKQNEFIQLRSIVLQYPSKLALLSAQEKSAEANKLMAELNLQRCTIKSPFRGRIESGEIEVGQFLSAGQKILTLADDTTMEIPVPIESSEALILGIFKYNNGYSNWFGELDKVHAVVEWVDDTSNHFWEAVATRVEKYDPETRTVTLVVSPLIQNPNQESLISKIFNLADRKESFSQNLPLIAGMFCKVRLKGPSIPNLIEVPRSAIQFKGKLAVVDRDGRISDRDVSILYRGEENVLIEKGLSDGETVIIQRLPFGITSGMKVKTLLEESK